MSLLREIQNDLARTDADAVSVLRKCKILAARLNSPELTRWVDCELDGFPDTQPVPEYRKLAITYYLYLRSIGNLSDSSSFTKELRRRSPWRGKRAELGSRDRNLSLHFKGRCGRR